MFIFEHKDYNMRDGVTMVPWARGRCMAWDVTDPDTLAPSHVQATVASAGAAASSSEALKSAKCADLAATHTFISRAFETLGSWGEHARHFVAELGRRTLAVTGDSRETAFLRQRISVAIQRGNALAYAGTLGPSQGSLPRLNYRRGLVREVARL